MKTFVLLALALAVVLGGATTAHARPRIAVEHPSAQASFPFFCDWGYDWDERCYWDTWSPRLAVGGDLQRVWRGGLRFPLTSVPRGATILQAELFLYFDGSCVGVVRPQPCDGRPWELELVPVLEDWFDEREPAHGFPVAWQWLPAAAESQWLVLDVSDLVAEWLNGGMANHGALVKLSDDQEVHGAGGPAFPGRSFPDVALRPRLEVTFLPPP